ncbi:MAG: protoporphyrinogen oxidase [Fidelibacterota bacterium]
MRKSVVVIGGGIAGLTAALKLKQAGIKVTLLERNSRLGGAICSVREGGFLVEQGPNTILETSPRVGRLIQELGLEREKVYAGESSRIRYVVRGGKPIPLPLSPVAFFRSPLFTSSAKWRLLKEPFIPPWRDEKEETLSHFVRRRLGQEFLDYAVNPFVAGVYAGDPETLSTRHGFPRLFRLEQRYGSLIRGQIKGAKERRERGEPSRQTARIFSFLEGLKTLPDAFERALGPRVIKNARTEDIAIANGKWRVTFADDRGEKRGIFADSVVYAVQARELPNLTINGRSVSSLSDFREIYHPPLSVVALGFRRLDVDHPLDGFGMLIPEVEGFNSLGVLFSSSLFPSRAPVGSVLLTAFVGGARQPEHALKGEGELVDMILKDLRILLGINSRPTFVHHVFWEKSIPQYNVGYGRFKKKLDRFESEHPGLFFSGNYRGGISIPDTMETSIKVAERVLSSHSHSG